MPDRARKLARAPGCEVRLPAISIAESASWARQYAFAALAGQRQRSQHALRVRARQCAVADGLPATAPGCCVLQAGGRPHSTQPVGRGIAVMPGTRHPLLRSWAPHGRDMQLLGQAKGDSERDRRRRRRQLDASPLHVRERDQHAAAAVSSCCRLVKLT